MAFFKKKETKIIISKADRTIMDAFTPKMKKKVYTWFESKRKKEQTRNSSKDIGSVKSAEDFIPRLNVATSMKKTIQQHDDIVMFLEKIGNERFRRDIENPIEKQSQVF